MLGQIANAMVLILMIGMVCSMHNLLVYRLSHAFQAVSFAIKSWIEGGVVAAVVRQVDLFSDNIVFICAYR